MKTLLKLTTYTLLLLGIFTLPTYAATTRYVERISVDSTGVQGNDGSYLSSTSTDGRFVTFTSDANNLVPGDTNARADIFVYDRDTDSIERVSVSGTGVEGNDYSYESSISADGRFVTFYSAANNLVPGDTNARADIFVYDRDTDSIERVSVSGTGVEGNHVSYQPSISADGRFVTFTSRADNLVSGDTNARDDIFVYDQNTDTVERVSVSSSGVQGNIDSYEPSISADGRFVTFTSDANNLVPGDANVTEDIFVYDRDTDTVERVSVSSSGVQGNDGSYEPSISTNGRFVTFTSAANNLVPGDTNSMADVFVYDRDTDNIERVSVSGTGVEGNDYSYVPSISTDGRFVTFTSDANNLVPGDANVTEDIFVYDRDTDTVERVSVSSSGVEGNNFSGFSSISADGRFVTFTSDANNLVPGDTNSIVDVFVTYTNEDPTDISLSNNVVTESIVSPYLVGVLTATDAEGDSPYTYSLSCAVPGLDDGSFNISTNNLRLNVQPDYETKSIYSLCIRVTDNLGGVFDKNFNVYVSESTPPTQPVMIDLLTSSDTGISSTDNVTSDNTPDVSLICSEVGNTLKVYSGNDLLTTYTCTTTGPVTLNLIFPVTNASYVLSYTDTNGSGQESARSTVLNLVIQTSTRVEILSSTNSTKPTVVVVTEVGDKVTIPNFTCTPTPATGSSVSCVSNANLTGSSYMLTVSKESIAGVLGSTDVSISINASLASTGKMNVLLSLIHSLFH
ncbi:PD40 domain-containing protein [bacterium]|nr:MAG: PD40 domain-containing protein [bacterium]